MDAIYARGDRLMLFFILMHLLIALLLASAYNTWAVTLTVAGLSTTMFLSSLLLLPRTFFTRCIAGFSLQLFVVLHIYQMHGMAELHFFFFTAFTMMIAYQDWRSMWLGTLLIIGQHTLFALLTNSGVNLFFYPESYISVTKLLFHFGIALAQVGVCGYWSVLLRRQTFESARQLQFVKDAKEVMEGQTQQLQQTQAALEAELVERQKTETALRESRVELSRQNENLEHIVTERTQELLHQAFHDPLTGLPNRAQVLYHLQQMADRKRTDGKAILFIDLDNFKFINDSLGHGAGDELLIAVTARLRACVRPEDMVARLGGDEFLIVVENVETVDIVTEIAQRILEKMNAGFSLSAGEGFTSASIGIAYTEASAIKPDVLIRDADTAMYHAKSNGKSAYALFEADMNDRLSERVEMEVGLRLALEQQEFCVHYQPLIDMKTGQLTGAEALVRWQHPTKGLIAPSKFISLAEETGLIVPLGYWVLEEACRQTASWKQSFPDQNSFIINVNLSGKQLQKPDVVERVQEILLKTGMDARNLKLEITESVMMTDMEDTIAKLTALRKLGVKLAMDDFGTGYSSMACLSSFPLDTVKIDRAFITRLNTHPDASSVIAAIIMLAKSLNIEVTGEGVETQEQVTILQGLGCDTGQGLLIQQACECGKNGRKNC